MITDFGLIFVLILLNGFFAAAEIAVVSAREARLQTRAEGGDPRATSALNLQRKPGEFLATVQVGITLVATLASAVGGVEAARVLAPLLAEIPPLEPYASQIALVLVVLAIGLGVRIMAGEIDQREGNSVSWMLIEERAHGEVIRERRGARSDNVCKSGCRGRL